MSKILYPVGTLVIVKKFPEVGAVAVTDYKKGEKYPYRVEGISGKKFSVKGLKRYNPTQAKVAEASPTVSAPMNCNCYTKEEVDVLLAHQWQDILEMLSNVDRVAVEALRNTHMIADMTDSNFRKVAKQFKTLNHDDD